MAAVTLGPVSHEVKLQIDEKCHHEPSYESLYFSPNFVGVQQHEDLTGAANPLVDVFARACAFR
jgi:hypothetical protein